ncbi:membrane protein [Paenibacillus baekrokdamisoli]|uniref:Membrane protein n=1 Tax=Paenibacillus baekrokdamisoli TaxID=1712516 RepID=A0A3G9JL59_9BACL|nr:metal-dependent hydrolase [Paenibacillus baekrokdamisoli]MBB3069518.1 inner membrane protein [Paenibacillus baekrokdamisoli]BBH24908.1 membrane protein [Paenibacillus baekrokdamisoli]
MKGSTHLAIGTAIGIAAAAYYPFTLSNAALYVSVAAFSALSADLDGTSILSSKISKVSKLLRELLLWGGITLALTALYLYFVRDFFDLTLTSVAVMIFLIGFITKEGVIRNTLVSIIGLGIIYAGFYWQWGWLMGFGLFTAWAPWLKHRGMTHTIWAAVIWGSLGYGLQNQLQVEGLMNVSFIGYLSHLVADTVTPAGVKWLYPLYKKSIKL